MGEPQFFGLRAGSSLLFFWISGFRRARVGQNLLLASGRVFMYLQVYLIWVSSLFNPTTFFGLFWASGGLGYTIVGQNLLRKCGRAGQAARYPTHQSSPITNRNLLFCLFPIETYVVVERLEVFMT